ncbi:MAG TPA: hypothetical protein VKF17_09600 [Isosphaeraceae bacterium]|nr:hypothetical protein [Isosphaeraceae bacterium]
MSSARRPRARPDPTSIAASTSSGSSCWPPRSRKVSEEKPYLTWTVTPGGEQLLAQVFAHQFGNLDEQDASWPQARLKVFPAEPRQGKIRILSEVVGSHMSWSVWTISQSGQVAVAPALHFGVTPVRVK